MDDRIKVIRYSLLKAYSKPRKQKSKRSLSFQDSVGGHNNVSWDAIVCFGERITAFPWLLVIVHIAG